RLVEPSVIRHSAVTFSLRPPRSRDFRLKWHTLAHCPVTIDNQQQTGDVHRGTSEGADHPPRLHFFHRIHEVGPVFQHRALNKPLSDQPDRHDAEPANRPPRVPTGESAGPELATSDPGPSG